MILLQAEDLTKSYNEKPLFTDISFGIHKGQKVALIAKNGTGKTTLLKILAGIEHADTGNVIIRNDLSLAYLDQNPTFDDDMKVLEGVFDLARDKKTWLNSFQETISINDTDVFTEDYLKEAHEQKESLQLKQILSQLEINNFEQKIGTLSGGQKKRLALAAVLIGEPDILLLDEPTNHLDVHMIDWLEKYLERANCTLFMVTHDRYFLDRVCNDIIEIDNGQLYRYKGNYSYFLEKRSERIHSENSLVEKSRNLMRKELEWMRRMPLARTTKSKARIDAFYDLKKTAESKRIDKDLKITFKAARLGKKIIEIDYISKKYDSNVLFDNFAYTFKPLEKIGIVGKNGSGKTTLLNVIAALEKPDKGQLNYGETLSIGYYRQEGISFNEDQKVIDIAKEIAEVIPMSDGSKVSASEFLRHFLFTNEMQYTPVSKLSGGEKRRLYLMTILMRNPNFLILDEPTNDFDILTLNVLEEYLNNFKGCVLMVSHDRFFMDKIVEHLFVFEENGVINDFPGNYTQYMLHKKAKELKYKKEITNQIVQKEKVNHIKEKPKKLSYKEQKEFDALELELEALENEKRTIEEDMTKNTLTHDEILQKSLRLEEILRLIDQKSDRWLELSLLTE